MKVISLIGQKGGAGKSTIARILTSAAVMQSKRVVLLDCDPNKSTFTFYEKLTRNDPASAQSVMGFHCSNTQEMEARIIEADEAGDVDYCIVDTQGDLVKWVDDVIELSDRVIIPVKVSETDFTVQMATYQRYEALREALADPSQLAPVMFLLNQIKPGVKYPISLRDLFDEMASHERMLRFYVQERNIYNQTDQGILLGEYANRVTQTAIGNATPKYLTQAMDEAKELLTAVDEVLVNG